MAETMQYLEFDSWNSNPNAISTLGQVIPEDDGGGGHGADAVQQRLAPEVEIDEGGHDADLGAAQPQPDVLRLVLHEERHAVAVAEPRGQEIVRQPVAVLIQL